MTVYDLKPIFLAAVRRGVELRPSFFDAMLAVYLVNPGRKDYAIDSVLGEFIGVDIDGGEERRTLAESALHLGELKEALLARIEGLGHA